VPPPSDRRGGTGLYGNPKNGQLIYDKSCLHCHYRGKYSFLHLDDSRLSFKHLKKNIGKYSRHSLYQELSNTSKDQLRCLEISDSSTRYCIEPKRNMTPEEIVSTQMYDNDAFSKWLGIELVTIESGSCTLQMTEVNRSRKFAIYHVEVTCAEKVVASFKGTVYYTGKDWE